MGHQQNGQLFETKTDRHVGFLRICPCSFACCFPSRFQRLGIRTPKRSNLRFFLFRGPDSPCSTPREAGVWKRHLVGFHPKGQRFRFDGSAIKHSQVQRAAKWPNVSWSLRMLESNEVRHAGVRRPFPRGLTMTPGPMLTFFFCGMVRVVAISTKQTRGSCSQSETLSCLSPTCSHFQ